jgi:hypothetical protein
VLVNVRPAAQHRCVPVNFDVRAHSMTSFIKGLALAALFAVFAAAYALLNAGSFSGGLQALLLWVASFACFGFLVGGIYAFDPRSEFKIRSSSTARVATGAIAGMALCALWRWPGAAIALAALVGAVLGYLGLLWARIVEHA